MEIIANTIKSNTDKCELYSESYPYNLHLRISHFETGKEFESFIKNCEKIVRNSLEYKTWRNYILDVLQINSCAITDENIQDCSVEIHHAVPSLFILVKAIINEKLDNGEEFCTFDIATKVIEFHYMNRIGYVPLASTIHERVTNNNFEIPIELINGDYKYFIDNYIKYLDEDEVQVINRRLAFKIENVDIKWSKDNYPGILKAVGE